MDAIRDFCTANDIPWVVEIEGRFERYLDLLLHFNTSMNLIGPLDESEIIDELLIDSLTAAAVHPPAGAMLDVGTGAGLPGYPLVFCYPELSATLVEPRRKRATFLKIVRTKLELDEVDIVAERLEHAPPGEYDYVISKAFKPPVEWLEVAADWTSNDGVIVCMTRPSERESLLHAADAYDLGLVSSCDDTTMIGAPLVGETRAVYVFGPDE